MALASNIVRRGAIYYVRVAVPHHLVDRFGRRELWRSLRTSDPTAARTDAPAWIARARGVFDMVAGDMTLTKERIAELVRGFYDRELVIDGVERRSSVPVSPGASDMRLDLLRQLEVTLTGHLARGEFALVQDFADEALDPEGVALLGAVGERPLLVDRTSPAYRELCQGLLRARLEATRRQIERHQGNWAGTPSDPILTAPAAPEHPQAPPPPVPANANTSMPALPPLPKLVKDFLAAKEREGIAAKTLGEMGTALDWFMDYFGKDRPTASFTKKDLIAYRDDLLNLPAYWEVRCKGMTIKEACRHGVPCGIPCGAYSWRTLRSEEVARADRSNRRDADSAA